ncbi:flippase-like domain-containing protein [Rhodopirellula sp.]|nr:lysylphosphatidylglycerol synthase transmembrane domain-containing protein [Rhodopirellula sp.]MDB4678863.1 flippase-like domain-containing protein [Rhodopirellula sp.]
MSEYLRRIPWLTLVKFTLPVVIIVFLLNQVEPEQWTQLAEQDKNYPLLCVALLVAIFALSLSFVRWCFLVRCQGIDLSMLEAFRLGAIGYLFSFISVGSVGGDVFKAAFLAKRRPGKRLAAVASVIVDRGCGLFALMLIVGIGLLFLEPRDESGSGASELDQIRRVTYLLLGLGTGVLFILVFGGRRVDRLISRFSGDHWLGRILDRVAPPLRMFHSHPIAFGCALLLSLVVQAAFPVSIFMIAKALFADAPTMGEHYVIVPVAMLASALPITFAGVGVLEAALESLYQWIPAVPTAASGFLVAVVFEIVRLVIAVIGTVFYWTANAEVRDSLEAANEQNQGPDPSNR